MAWPTTDDPRTEVVTLRLTKTEMADLEDYARREGVSRSAAVRTALERLTELPEADNADDQEIEEET